MDCTSAGGGTAGGVVCVGSVAGVLVVGAALAAFRLNANLVFGAAAVRSDSSWPSRSFSCYQECALAVRPPSWTEQTHLVDLSLIIAREEGDRV